MVFWTLTKSRAKSHVKDGPLRRKDVAIWKGGVGSNFVGPGSRFARLRGADPWRHGRGRVCLGPMDSDDRKCPAIVVNRCISLRQKLQPHGGMAARNFQKPSTSTFVPGPTPTETPDRDFGPRLETETPDRDSRLETQDRDSRQNPPLLVVSWT